MLKLKLKNQNFTPPDWAPEFLPDSLLVAVQDAAKKMAAHIINETMTSESFVYLNVEKSMVEITFFTNDQNPPTLVMDLREFLGSDLGYTPTHPDAIATRRAFVRLLRETADKYEI